jgi:hypothetical protein
MPPRKKNSLTQIPPPSEEDGEESDASEDMTDPEDDIDASEFECVLEAARDRTAPRTRRQYDLFVGLMKTFFLSQPDLQKEVVQDKCKLPLSITAVERYLTHVESKRREYEIGKFKPVSPSYYRTVVRSVHDLYICNQLAIEDKLRLLMYSRTKAFVRRIAEMKATGAYPIGATRAISGQGYKLLCASLAKATPAEDGWAWQLVSCIWSYVVLLWCLLARCDRVAQLRWEDFSWTGDALTVFIQKSKSDQCGDRAYHKKLFTSDDPATCPVLAVAVLFFSRDLSNRSEFIFPRADTRRAGLRQLSRLIRIFFREDQFASFGCNPLDIAWHHFKRGGMTFLSSKMDGPSHVAVKMRADQTVMDVSRFYIAQSTGQDGYIGRLLSMLPYGEPGFTQQEYVLPTSTLIQWSSLVPDYDGLPITFRYEVVPKIFASICKHQSWLRQTLPRGHPLLASELFTVHDRLLQGAMPHVLEMTRPMGECTGLPLSLQTHLLLRQHLNPPPATQRPPAAPLYLSDAALPAHTDLSMRALRPLPKAYRLTKLSIVGLWRAWWSDTSTEPMPLRMMEGKFPNTPEYAGDRTRYTRYKTVIKFIQSEMPANCCIEQTTLAFGRGWRSLATYLDLHHQIRCDPDSAPSTLYGSVKALASRFNPPAVRSVHAAGQPARPLDEVLLEHLKNLEHSEQSGAAATIVQDIRGSIAQRTQHGWLNVLDCWPKPGNRWVDGAVQGAKCVCCDKYKASHKQMREHLQQHMKVDEREKHFRQFNGVWVYNALETKWCVTVQGPVHSKLVPVESRVPISRGNSASAGVATTAGTPSAPPQNTCCCGATFKTFESLKRHHNGIGGKRPRDPAHACTSDCML